MSNVASSNDPPIAVQPSGSSISASTEDNLPLWQYVTKLEAPKTGGNWLWRCNYCEKQFKSSYTRVRAHLLRVPGNNIGMCHGVKADHLNEMRRLQREADERVNAAKPKEVSLPSSQPLSKRHRSLTNTISNAFNNQERDELDCLIARMFYSAGLPFSLAKNPWFVRAFTYAASHALSGYIPPGYNRLRTSLLQQEKAHIERLLEPIKSTWGASGISICSDGWSDPRRRPIINFIAVSQCGPMFLSAINAEGEFKDGVYISERFIEKIMEVGPQNVVQIITDNAANCTRAGRYVENRYMHIFWSPCVVHTLNLALKNICAAKDTEGNEEVYDQCSWIHEVAEEAILIKNFIMNHSMRLHLFNRHSKLTFLSIAETRFASTIVMLKRFQTIKRDLQDMVLDAKWQEYRDDNRQRASTIRLLILSDDWWDKVEYIIRFTEPIYDMLRAADTDKGTLHLIYEMWDAMIEKVKGIIFREEKKRDYDTSEFFDVVQSILIYRWNKSNTPLHCLAHSLNPRYYSLEWLSQGRNRMAPHLDNELATERNNALKRLFTLERDRDAVMIEFNKFSTCKDYFADSDCIRARSTMDPSTWWGLYGMSTPALQSLALRLLSQPSSSSCCERNWSTYSHIHSLKRNKLTPARAEDLVFIHSNLRLLSRREPTYSEKGETSNWDIAGDAFDNLDDENGAGVLESATLSFDLPELESNLLEIRASATDGQGSGGAGPSHTP